MQCLSHCNNLNSIATKWSVYQYIGNQTYLIICLSLLLYSLQSMVQSYLEGVGFGLEQLQRSRAELMQVSQALKKTGLESNHSTDGVRSLEKLREVSLHHRQLLTAVSNLPQLYSGDLWV